MVFYRIYFSTLIVAELSILSVLTRHSKVFVRKNLHPFICSQELPSPRHIIYDVKLEPIPMSGSDNFLLPGDPSVKQVETRT